MVYCNAESSIKKTNNMMPTLTCAMHGCLQTHFLIVTGRAANFFRKTVKSEILPEKIVKKIVAHFIKFVSEK